MGELDEVLRRINKLQGKAYDKCVEAKKEKDAAKNHGDKQNCRIKYRVHKWYFDELTYLYKNAKQPSCNFLRIQPRKTESAKNTCSKSVPVSLSRLPF